MAAVRCQRMGAAAELWQGGGEEGWDGIWQESWNQQTLVSDLGN